MVQEIKRRLAAGVLKAGGRLPSERELAHSVGVSRSSVQSAFRELEAMGLVLRQPNRRPLVLPVASKRTESMPRVADQIAVWIR